MEKWFEINTLEPTGIQNGGRRQPGKSSSAVDCVTHLRGESSQGCLTTILNKSIVQHFEVLGECVYSGCIVCSSCPQAENLLTQRAR